MLSLSATTIAAAEKKHVKTSEFNLTPLDTHIRWSGPSLRCQPPIPLPLVRLHTFFTWPVISPQSLRPRATRPTPGISTVRNLHFQDEFDLRLLRRLLFRVPPGVRPYLQGWGRGHEVEHVHGEQGGRVESQARQFCYF